MLWFVFVYFAGEHVYCKQVKKSPLGRIKLSFSYTFVFGKRSDFTSAIDFTWSYDILEIKSTDDIYIKLRPE